MYPDFLNPDIFVADLKKLSSTRSVFESNSPVHTYPAGIWIYCSAQYSSVNIVNRTCAKQCVLVVWPLIERFRITPLFVLMSWGNMLILCAVDH